MLAELETAETRSFLFTLELPLGWFAQRLEFEARIQTPARLERCFESRQLKKPGKPGFLLCLVLPLKEIGLSRF
jgi:hypothetical protein